jgi:ankyrin repeat protein
LPIALQVDTILKKNTKEQIREQKAELQRSLHSVYQDNLDRIRDQELPMADLAKRTLTWLFYCQRPLETVELFEILHFSAHHALEISIPIIIESCMTLVCAGELVAFTHFSVKEFLEENMHTATGDEKMIAVHCLQYLINSNIEQATTHKSISDQLRGNPFLSYAATYWGRHLCNATQKDGGEHENLIRLCSTLLNNKPKVASLCHVIFMLRKEVPADRLVKSSWLHLVAYFGLHWAMSPPLVEEALVDEQDEWGRTPLHLAALNGFVDCVTILLNQESQGQQDFDGRTVWHYAAMSGNPETIRRLVILNCHNPKLTHVDPSVGLKADKLEKSPLEYAAINGDTSAFNMLLPFYSSESGNDLRSRALWAALAGGKIDIVKYLLSQGEKINYCYLLQATEAGFEAAVELLVDYGSQIDKPDAARESALMIAAREGRNKILSYLIWNGANLESTDADGQTALTLAVKTSNDEGVRILLQAGANPTRRIIGVTLAEYAASHGLVEIVQLLLRTGVEPYAAALAAAKNGRVEVLEQLFQRGLLPDLSSNQRQRQSLVAAAKEAAQSSILDILESPGSEVSPRPVYSDQPDATGDPEPSFQKIKTQDEGASPLSEAPSKIDPVSAKSLEASGLKYAQEKEGAGKGLAEQPLELSESQTKEIRSTLISSQQPSRDESRLVRSSGLNNVAMPFLLLSEPISAESLSIGSIVANPMHPMHAYAPRNASSLLELVRENRYESIQTDYQTLQEKNSTSRFALEVLRPVLNLEATQNRVAAIASQHVVRLQLKNHEEVLSRILNDSLIREEIFRMAKSLHLKELFIVVGTLTASDLLVSVKRQSWAVGTAGLGFGKAAQSESSEVRYAGDRIFAVSYRIVKIRTSRSLRSIVTQGSTAAVTDVFVDNYFAPKAHERLF